ncbi:MAG: alpha/beta hydrolase [Opitutaceae bacterium]|nr:alpha/beta hydrolase [Cytophagales bacterium]
MFKYSLYTGITLLLSGCKLFVPSKYQNYFSDQPWDNIRLAKTDEIPQVVDSMVIMRSNREFYPYRKKFLGDKIDSTQQDRTFLVIAKNSKWIVYPVKDINSGISLTNKKQDLVVYVEGMGKNFYHAGHRAFGLSSQYKVLVVMMDYPSIEPEYGLIKNFRYARKNSFATAPSLINLLKELDNEKIAGKDWTKENWTLFHHSMGNIMLKRIMKERSDTILSPGLFDLVVFNAACTEMKNHHLWLEQSKLGKINIIHYNQDDRQLKGARILALKRQLGCKPGRHLAKNATYIDFNPLVGPRHSTFAEIPLRPPIHPHAREYFNQIFNGKYPDYKNKDKFSKVKNGTGYYLK